MTADARVDIAAACAGKPPNLWFPAADRDEDDRVLPSYEAGDNHGRMAKSICRTCPVREACATGAVERNEQYGIHGGAGEDVLRWLRRAWVIDGPLGGPLWRAALARHFAQLDGERLPVVNRNGPGATCGRRVTYARNCRCDACSLAAAIDGVKVKVRNRGAVAA